MAVRLNVAAESAWATEASAARKRAALALVVECIPAPAHVLPSSLPPADCPPGTAARCTRSTLNWTRQGPRSQARRLAAAHGAPGPGRAVLAGAAAAHAAGQADSEQCADAERHEVGHGAAKPQSPTHAAWSACQGTRDMAPTPNQPPHRPHSPARSAPPTAEVTGRCVRPPWYRAGRRPRRRPDAASEADRTRGCRSPSPAAQGVGAQLQSVDLDSCFSSEHVERQRLRIPSLASAYAPRSHTSTARRLSPWTGRQNGGHSTNPFLLSIHDLADDPGGALCPSQWTPRAGLSGLSLLLSSLTTAPPPGSDHLLLLITPGVRTLGI